MEIERFLPLIVLWIIWRLLSRSKAKHPKQKKQKAMTGRIPEPDRFKKPVSIMPPMPPMEKISIKDENVDTLPDDAEKTTDEKPAVALKTEVIIKSSPKLTTYSPKFLKKAIVWSEILGPPVGLRED